MVLLGANPLDAICNTRVIDAIVLRGRMLDRARLDAILAAVRDTNDRSRRIPR